ncbi:MAG TPA: flagellar hook basal-body protein [Planctomycetota bacterium]|nr:flagellar hook basal-body protein [Planctomycetota bacterium]
MPKGIYAAASAMVVETRAQEVNARNLANQQTPGYREESVRRNSFANILRTQGRNENIAGDGGAGVLPAGSYYSFTEGQLEPTAAPYDLGLRGEGFYRVRDDQGRVLLTRAAHFMPDTQGRLVTPQGWVVEGQRGAITVPANARRIVVDTTGRVTAETIENGVAQQTVIDQLRVVTVADTRRLTPLNGQYFDPTDQAMSDATKYQVAQGNLEKANLEPLEQMVEMIAVSRRYDAAQRALKEQANVGGGLSELLRGGA